MKGVRTLFAGIVVIVGAQFIGHAIGCASASTPEPKDPTSALIEKCTIEARAAYYVNGKSFEDAMHIYDACMAGVDAGHADGGADAR